MPANERPTFDPLDGDDSADVVVVGAGFTGLWTAVHLLGLDPGRRVVVLDAHGVGHGASGRNGGWCSALLPMDPGALVERHGRAATIRFADAMRATVDDITRFCALEGIDADIHKGGTVDLARTAPQEARLRSGLDEARRFGVADGLEWLDADGASRVCGATSVRGGLFSPHCAVVHPLRLVHGVARTAVRRGAVVHEHTRVTAIEPGLVRTQRGDVRSPIVIRATEGYTAGLPGARRELLPIYSMMVATAPLPADAWAAIGLADRTTFTDGRRGIIYGQRTADGRLAFGGRGAPYHFGSAVRSRFDTDPGVRDRLTETLRSLFPVIHDAEITHHWGGPLGVARDWHCSVRFDRRTGLGSAGGYVGDGVATSYLAGRTLAHLITGVDDDIVRLPWVGHRSRRWEPEPLRWLGVNAGRFAVDRADAAEERLGRASRPWELAVAALLGR
jgi:glycine/D-amino acid oxidase-like deaminating enzyme